MGSPHPPDRLHGDYGEDLVRHATQIFPVVVSGARLKVAIDAGQMSAARRGSRARAMSAGWWAPRGSNPEPADQKSAAGVSATSGRSAFLLVRPPPGVGSQRRESDGCATRWLPDGCQGEAALATAERRGHATTRCWPPRAPDSSSGRRGPVAGRASTVPTPRRPGPSIPLPRPMRTTSPRTSRRTSTHGTPDAAAPSCAPAALPVSTRQERGNVEVEPWGSRIVLDVGRPLNARWDEQGSLPPLDGPGDGHDPQPHTKPWPVEDRGDGRQERSSLG